MKRVAESMPVHACLSSGAITSSQRARIGSRNLLVLGATLPLAVLSSALARRVLLALIVLDIPLEFEIHFYYDETLANLGALGGLSISITTIAVALLYANWLLERALRPCREGTPRPRISRPLLGYVILVGASTLVAKDPRLSLYEFLLILQTFLLYVYVLHWVKTRNDVVFVAVMLFAGLALEGGLSIAMRNLTDQVRVGGIKSQVDPAESTENIARVGGTVGSPNHAAGYFVGVMAPAFALLLSPVRGKHRWLAFVAFCFGAAALALTVSRGGWVGGVVALLWITAASMRRRGRSVRLPIIMLVPLCVVWIAFGSMLETRLFTADEGSAHSRVPLMKLAMTMVEHNPVLGVGANNFPVCIPDYAGWNLRGEWLYTVHNRYLLVWSETGTLALVCYISFLVEIVRRGWRVWRAGHPFLSPLALGISSAMSGLMVHMFVEVFRGRAVLQLTFLMAALLASMEVMVEMHQRADRGATSLTHVSAHA